MSAASRREVRSLVLLETELPPRTGAGLRNRCHLAALTGLGPTAVFALLPRRLATRFELGGVAELEVASRPRLGPLRRLALLADPRVCPFAARRLDRDVLRRCRELFDRFRPDVVVCEQLAVAGLLAALPDGGSRHLVYDAHNVEGTLRRGLAAAAPGAFARLRTAARFRGVAALEGRVCRGSQAVWACSPREAAALEADYRPTAPVEVIPNAIDVSAYAERRARPDALSADAVNLLFVGSFGYEPNLQAARRLANDILPLVRERIPAARAVIVGRDADRRLTGLASGAEGVTIVGEVDDVRPYFQHADVLVVPLETGGGTRLKILEALASGCPVVSTAKGAEGLELETERHLLVAELVRPLAEAVLRLHEDPETRGRLVTEGRDLVASRYSTERIAELVQRSVIGLLERPSGRAA